jgi:beta-barrel assembly-enhancing protease
MRHFFLASVVLVLCSATLLSETFYASRKTNALREGPGSYYSLIASVAESTALLVLGRSGSWVKVQLPDKQVGWIAANSLRAENGDQMAARSPEAMWSSPKALSAAIKGFGKKFVKGDAGIVDSVLRCSEKGFTNDDLAAFEKEIRQYPSRNRGRMKIEDLDLPVPEYYTDLPEQQIGVSTAARIGGSGMVTDRQLLRYANMVCATIVEQSELYDADFTVLVLRDGKINAFAVPGGYLFLTLGLIRECRDESELAGIVAHEIAHVYRRHGLQELSKRLAGIHADAAFSELEEEVGEPAEDEKEMEALMDETYEKVVHPRLLSYEIEADRIGAILAANAGYDPFGLVRISERVARVSTDAPDIFDPDYMLPSDAVKRSKDIRAFAEEHFKTDKPGEQMSARFMAVTAPVRGR